MCELCVREQYNDVHVDDQRDHLAMWQGWTVFNAVNMSPLLFRCLAVYFFCSAHACRTDAEENAESMQIKISMPLVRTTISDQYICHAYPLDAIGDAFVLKSITEADGSIVHHATTGVCEEPASTTTTWDCTQTQGHVCKGDAVNLGGWDDFSEENAFFEFPKDVSLRVGDYTRLKYFLLQIHFKDPIENPQYAVANVTLDFTRQPTRLNYQTYLLFNTGLIPANKDKGYLTESACLWELPPVMAYSYFVHTHYYGILVEGFLIRNGTWTLLGSQLSLDKKKNLLDIPGGPIEIQPGDIVAARCLYINNQDKPVKFGMSAGEEMCNFQINFGYDPRYFDDFRRPPACRARTPDFSFCDQPQTKGIC